MAKEKGGKHAGGKKAGEGGRGSFTAVSPATVEYYLKGVDFPCNKDELLDHAQNQGAPDDVIFTLGQLEDREYDSLLDISRELGKIE